VRKHACKRKRGCIRKDAPAPRGENRQVRNFHSSFAYHPEDKGAPEAVKAATTCAKRKAQRADAEGEARGRAPQGKIKKSPARVSRVIRVMR